MLMSEKIEARKAKMELLNEIDSAVKKISDLIENTDEISEKLEHDLEDLINLYHLVMTYTEQDLLHIRNRRKLNARLINKYK